MKFDRDFKYYLVNRKKSFKRKRIRNSFSRKYYFRKPNKNGKLSLKSVNPKDPLNLLELEKQQEERLNMGLSPLPGDSAFNTPVISNDHGDDYNFTKFEGTLPCDNFNIYYNNNNNDDGDGDDYDGGGGCGGNTRPEERLKYFLPDWFDHSNVCEYGCHRGEFAFKLFELFHRKISRLDCIDVRRNCILNAKHLQREKYRCEMMTVGRQLLPRPREEAINYSKINFKVANWVKDDEEGGEEGCEYDLIIALGVTRLVHLYYGDIGLEKFLRRACHRLKPGGHLVVELQTASRYREALETISKPFIVKNFRNMKIQPDKLEPLLASVGFPYCCKISTTEEESRDILLCTKPIGTTPVPIRDTNTTELMLKYSRHRHHHHHGHSYHGYQPPPPPPPVIYNPGSRDTIVVTVEAEEGPQLPDSTISD